MPNAEYIYEVPLVHEDNNAFEKQRTINKNIKQKRSTDLMGGRQKDTLGNWE